MTFSIVTFLLSQKETLYPFSHHFSFSPPPCLGNTNLPMSLDISIMDFSFKWSHKVSGPWHLVSGILLSIMFSRFVHFAACVSTSFLFMAGSHSIEWIYHSLSIHQLMDIWVIPIIWPSGFLKPQPGMFFFHCPSIVDPFLNFLNKHSCTSF